MAAHMHTAWHHVRRSPYQSLAAILIMMITFLMISVFTFLIVGSHKIVTFFESKPKVTAFFTDDVKQTDIDGLQSQLKATNKVASIKFVSKQEALDIYKAQNKNDPLLLDLVTADILPASLEVSTYDPNDLSQIANIMKNNSFVKEIIFPKDVVSTLTTWTTGIRQIGVVIIALLTLESILVMAIIVGIKISQKRAEIEVMQLIGATKGYISWPFLYEGMLYGIIGAFSGWAVASIGIWYYTSQMGASRFFTGIPLLPVPLSFYAILLGGELMLAILLGFFASLLVVNRFLK
jgi:cell division transport system permease protein